MIKAKAAIRMMHVTRKIIVVTIQPVDASVIAEPVKQIESTNYTPSDMVNPNKLYDWPMDNIRIIHMLFSTNNDIQTVTW